MPNSLDSNFKKSLQQILQRLKAFVISTDALMFCFFIILATGIWYIHSLKKESNTGTQQEQSSSQQIINYTDKQLVQQVKPRGEPRGSEIILFPSEVKITARIDMEHYHDISADDFSAVCTYSPKADTQLPIEVSCSSPYVTSFRFQPQTAEYIIQKDASKN
ncbi:MAG: hypothetical protein IJS13_09500 [Paludibacteraceae bacterium]|nr:hypothetical protein [Paludibacteraceae bacterium]